MDALFALIIVVGGNVLSHIFNQIIDKYFFNDDNNNER